MRKEDFLRNEYTSFEDAARIASEYLWRYEKTEELIKALARNECYDLWNEGDIAYCVIETRAFDFSLDDVAYAHAIAEDEYMIDIQNTIDYLLNEMVINCKPEDRYTFYQRNVVPHIEDRDRYRAMFQHNFANLVFYKISK